MKYNGYNNINMVTRYYIFKDGKPHTFPYTFRSFKNFYEGYSSERLAKSARQRQIKEGLSSFILCQIVAIHYPKSVYNKLLSKKVEFVSVFSPKMLTNDYDR